MPTRTFIGLIFLVFALMVASTPAILEPIAQGIRSGLVSAGVPGIEKQEATRDKRERTGKVENGLMLKGYEVGKQDLQDTLPLGKRGQRGVGGRLVAGSKRTLLPGESLASDPLNPPVETKGGVLLDGAKCPVFRAGIDIEELWKDKAQQQKYLQKAASADNPAACKALLTNRVAAATNGDQVDALFALEAAKVQRSNDLGVSIIDDYRALLDVMFPGAEDGTRSSKSRANASAVLAQAGGAPTG